MTIRDRHHYPFPPRLLARAPRGDVYPAGARDGGVILMLLMLLMVLSLALLSKDRSWTAPESLTLV
ncbi:MAG: hypothetical protein ACRDF5_02805 [bacterium]